MALERIRATIGQSIILFARIINAAIERNKWETERSREKRTFSFPPEAYQRINFFSRDSRL